MRTVGDGVVVKTKHVSFSVETKTVFDGGVTEIVDDFVEETRGSDAFGVEARRVIDVFEVEMMASDAVLVAKSSFVCVSNGSRIFSFAEEGKQNPFVSEADYSNDVDVFGLVIDYNCDVEVKYHFSLSVAETEI